MRKSIFLVLASCGACTTLLGLSGVRLWGDEPAVTAVPAAASSTDAGSGKSPAEPVAETAPTISQSQRVHLNFRDEDWLPALGWLAKELHLNLDWQTLPEGKLSLFSTKDYSLAEAEDQINMQLLARGFTLLKRGEVLRLVPMKDIDITLVPRISPEELEGLEKHQVVRVSIPLEWMVAEKAALEFKPLLSPHGQLFPLATSNRLEVLDAVVNVRELVRLLKQAESDDGRRIRVMEFRLKYRNASEISSQVRQLIGMQSERSYSSSYQTQLDIEQAKFRAEAVKQLGNNAKDLIAEKKTDTFLVVNEKDNSIVVSAPPDKLEMVRQTIETLDKPLPPSESSWQTVTRVKVHPVNGFDPETIQRLLLSLQERGNLAKETRIQHEAAYNRIIAFASPEDHLTISQVIESYRAERRSAAVIPLTVVSPQYAVKAVQLILKNPDRPSTSPGVASDGKFQIEADPDNSRILLWATSEELKEVREFLLSLGETFDQSDNSAKLHVLSIGEADVPGVIERFREVWQQVSDSPLIIERKPTDLQPSAAGPESDAPLKPTRDRSDSTVPLTDKSRAATNADNVRLVSSATSEGAVAGLSKPDQAAGDSEPAVPPVRIIEGRDGDVVIVSRDPQAAGAARRLLQQLKPAPGDVRIITLKHAQAMTVRRQLEEMMASTRVAASSKLSTELPLSIEVDTRTNRLIIQHCNARQLDMIQDLIPVLDQPVAADGRLIRQQRLHRVLHRRASEISEVLKDVYRDLLSINDRAFSSYSSYRPMGYNQTLAATASNPEYQGLISIGSDAEANLLIVSAPGYLADEIIKLAESLDTPADGPAMAVVPAAGDSSDVKVREALSKILRKR